MTVLSQPIGTACGFDGRPCAGSRLACARDAFCCAGASTAAAAAFCCWPGRRRRPDSTAGRGWSLATTIQRHVQDGCTPCWAGRLLSPPSRPQQQRRRRFGSQGSEQAWGWRQLGRSGEEPIPILHPRPSPCTAAGGAAEGRFHAGQQRAVATADAADYFSNSAPRAAAAVRRSGGARSFLRHVADLSQGGWKHRGHHRASRRPGIIAAIRAVGLCRCCHAPRCLCLCCPVTQPLCALCALPLCQGATSAERASAHGRVQQLSLGLGAIFVVGALASFARVSLLKLAVRSCVGSGLLCRQ